MATFESMASARDLQTVLGSAAIAGMGFLWICKSSPGVGYLMRGCIEVNHGYNWVLRFLLWACEAFSMLLVLSIACGFVMWGIVRWIIVVAGSGTVPYVNEFDLVYYSVSIALIPLLGMINSNRASIMDVQPAPAPAENTYDSQTGTVALLFKTFLDLLVGDYDTMLPTASLFTPRAYAFFAGFIYVLEISSDISNFNHRLIYVYAAGGVGLVAAISLCVALFATLHRATVTKVKVARVFVNVTTTMFCLTGIFMGAKMLDMRDWVRIISGDMSSQLTFTLVCLPLPVVFYMAVSIWAQCRLRRGASGGGDDEERKQVLTRRSGGVQA